MDEEEIKQEFEKVWEKIKDLEQRINSDVTPKIQQKKQKETKKNYKGLGGCINLLIDNKFFDTLKSLNEIIDEMKREGYHHSKGSVSKMLSINFVKNKKVLTRLKEEKIWKYVVRK